MKVRGNLQAILITSWDKLSKIVVFPLTPLLPVPCQKRAPVNKGIADLIV